MHRRLAVFGVGLVSLSVLFPATTNAVDVYTDPVGFITLNIKGTNGLTAGTSSALSYLGLGMTQLVVKPGRITSVATNELVDANASWSDDQYNGANGPHFSRSLQVRLLERLMTSSRQLQRPRKFTPPMIWPHWALETYRIKPTGFESTGPWGACSVRPTKQDCWGAVPLRRLTTS